MVGSALPPLSKSNSSDMALLPISCVGCSMVVSGGSQKLANSMSSKPTTDTSWGTERPVLFSQRIAPSAISSLKQNTAVGGCLASNNFSAAARPELMLKSP